MRNPQDPRFLKIQQLHMSGRMVGMDRPVGRATWSKVSIAQTASTKPGVSPLRYLNKNTPQFEFGGIKTIQISRSIGQDAATCTITMDNLWGSSSQPEGVDTSGTVGYFTPGRGYSRGLTNRYNLIPNPNFETWGTQSYTTTGGSMVAFAGTPKFGTHYGLFRATNNGARASVQTRAAVHPNTTYTLSQYVRVFSLKTWVWGAYFFDAKNKLIGSAFGEALPNAATWTRVAHTFTTPANATSVVVTNLAWDTPPQKLLSTDEVHIDGVMLEPSAVLGDYFDGNFTDTYDYVYSYQDGFLNPSMSSRIARDVAPVTTSVFSTIQDPFETSNVTFPTDWNFPRNIYRDVFIPNTVIRTYQGYGSDNFDINGNEIYVHDPASAGYVAPQDDTQLYQTGLWLIDKVTFSAFGEMTVECRDAAKLLIEQYIYPPLIPMNRFPLIYCPAQAASGHKESIGRNTAVFSGSSVDAKYGKNASISGHRGTHAFDARSDTFWYSGPNASRTSYEWLQAATHGEINEIALNCVGGNYLVYVSVHENGKWQGTSVVSGSTENVETDETNGGFFYVITSGDTLWDLAYRFYGNNFLWPRIAAVNNNIIKDPHWIYPGQRIKIPYIPGTKTSSPGGGSKYKVTIPYVVRATVSSNGLATIALPRTYKADYVRVVFTNLQPLYGGQYRAGVRTMVARNHIRNTYNPGTIGKAGYIQDWTEPVKELAAWAGFTWQNATAPTLADPVLGKKGDGSPLRVWGDFEILGAGPIVCTPADYFVSKSFMDGIRQIVDFIGGIFYVDESGGVQFRLPNIWSGGNFIDDTSAPAALSARTTQHPIEFHEDANLMSYEMVISDESLRSEVLVIGGYPSYHFAGPVAGGYVLGYNSATGTTSAIDFTDVLAGQYRLMVAPGDATKLFYTEAECQRMAELTALFILFTYRQGSLKAPAHPGLQIDDQVRIFERVTAEDNIHYVSGISTTQDLVSGEYTMEVTTNWLGRDPNTDWFINKALLTPAVKQLPAILTRIGKDAGGGNLEQAPYGS